jgi:acyl carrier protein
MNIYEKLQGVFCEVFDIDSIQIKPELTAADVDEWDSLSHIRLMVAIEEEFGISFTSTEISSFKNVGELVTAIEKKSTK